MTLAGIYLFLAVLAAFCTLTAIVQARKLYWAVPVYFFSAWLCGELALIHLLWQLLLTALLAFAGVFDDPLAQTGLGIFALTWLGLIYLHCQAMDTPRFLRPALRRALGQNYRADIPADRQHVLCDDVDSRHWLKPFDFKRKGVRLHSHISYADGGKRNLLDIYHPNVPREGGFPVLLQVHGGAWMIGEKEQQAKPLMYHMAERGWLCVAINYRLSPDAAFPAHIIDVKKAIAWIRENISDYGGNPDFMAITGGSAGGHLSSLAALTPNKTDWQPGFEDADTTLQAAVPFYGVYDFLDRYDVRPGMSMEDMVAERVMQCTREENPQLWDDGSPLSHVRSDAPPMFVIQGTHDSLVWVEEARTFVSALQGISEQPVVYGELPGAQHAFEIFHSVRTDHTVHAVGHFLEWCHAKWLGEKSSAQAEAGVTTRTKSAAAESTVTAEAELKEQADDNKPKAKAKTKARAPAKAKTTAKAKAPAKAKTAAKAKAPAKAKTAAKAKPPAKAKTAAEAKAPAEAKTAAEAKAPAKAKTAAKAKAPAKAKTAAEAKAPAKAKTAAKAKAPAEAKTAAEAKAPAEAKTAAEAKAPAEAKTAAEAKAPAEAKTAAKAKAPAKAKTAAKAKAPAKAKTAAKAKTPARAKAAAKDNTATEATSSVETKAPEPKAPVAATPAEAKSPADSSAPTEAQAEPRAAAADVPIETSSTAAEQEAAKLSEAGDSAQSSSTGSGVQDAGSAKPTTPGDDSAGTAESTDPEKPAGTS